MWIYFPDLTQLKDLLFKCNSSQRKELSQLTPLPLAIEVFRCLHKQVDVFLHNCELPFGASKG
jgi:hypothetical protein